MTHMTVSASWGVDVGDLVDRVILHGNAHGGFHDEVVLIGAARAAESEIEEKLKGALDVIDEFLSSRIHIAKFRDES